MTQKEIRNKMYSLFSESIQKKDKDFVMKGEFRDKIKAIMQEYKDFFLEEKVETRKVKKKDLGGWKTYPC